MEPLKHDKFTELTGMELKLDSFSNVFNLLDKNWMLITSGNIEHFNTMTASWGGFGILWHKPVAFIFVRPTRHTFTFLETNSQFTLSFFSERYHKSLEICGTRSGRETFVNKIKEAGLNQVCDEDTNAVYFKEARMVLKCNKIYNHDLDPKKFILPNIEKQFYNNDYHRMYIGEITSLLSSPS